MNDTQRQAMAREIHASYEALKVQPNELTHNSFAEATGETPKVAERILRAEVAAGRMTRREARGDRCKLWAYARCTDQDGMQRNSSTGHYDDIDTDDIPS
jgi:hypothetical protein